MILFSAHTQPAVLIDDQDINTPNTDVVELRKRVGMVFQKSDPFPKSVFENVTYEGRASTDRTNMQKLVEIVEPAACTAPGCGKK